MNAAEHGLVWDETALDTEEWCQLDDLWLSIVTGAGETDVSWCHAAPGGSALEFAALNEIRIPSDVPLNASRQLAPRPILARPWKPLTIPSRQRVRLYVGTPLWLMITAGQDTVLDVPVSRVSDTWFGADTMNGEICFDCRTKARLSMDDIPRNPFKAITPIDLDNDSNLPVTVDRINLPVNHMALFENADRLWTSSMELHVDHDGRHQISSEPPAECADGTEIAPPRDPLESGILTKAIGMLLG